MALAMIHWNPSPICSSMTGMSINFENSDISMASWGDMDDAFDPFLPSFAATVEEQSLKGESMEINKESLKRKLLSRRTVAELADQGIYPPLKTPAAFAEQRKHLVIAKTGDMLRRKLTMRPDRQDLVEHHILEDQPCQQFDRQEKRCRLQEILTDHLVHRPGPLDLLSAKILHVDADSPEADRMMLSGTPPVQFDIGSDTGVEWASLTDDAVDIWDLSNGFDTLPSLLPPPIPASLVSSDNYRDLIPTTIAGDEIKLDVADDIKPVPEPPDIQPLLNGLHLNTASKIPVAPDITHWVEKPGKSRPVSATVPAAASGLSASNNSGTVVKPVLSTRGSVTKKPKPKIATKSKVMKFHQYLGPPGAQREQQQYTATATNDSSQPSAYNILLQQQQMLLQWQLEFQQKSALLLSQQQQEKQLLSSANVVASVAQVIQPSTSAPGLYGNSVVPVVYSSTSLSQNPVVVDKPMSICNSTPSRLEDLKVPELKQACLTYNLSRSGSKSALIERLQPYAGQILSNIKNTAMNAMDVDTSTAVKDEPGVVPATVNIGSGISPNVTTMLPAAKSALTLLPSTLTVAATAKFPVLSNSSAVYRQPDDVVSLQQTAAAAVLTSSTSSTNVSSNGLQSTSGTSNFPSHVRCTVAGSTVTCQGASICYVSSTQPGQLTTPAGSLLQNSLFGQPMLMLKPGVGLSQHSTGSLVMPSTNNNVSSCVPQMPFIIVRPNLPNLTFSPNTSGSCTPSTAAVNIPGSGTSLVSRPQLPVASVSCVQQPVCNVLQSADRNVAAVNSSSHQQLLVNNAAAVTYDQQQQFAALLQRQTTGDNNGCYTGVGAGTAAVPDWLQVAQHMHVLQQQLSLAQQTARQTQLNMLDAASNNTTNRSMVKSELKLRNSDSLISSMEPLAVSQHVTASLTKPASDGTTCSSSGNIIDVSLNYDDVKPTTAGVSMDLSDISHAFFDNDIDGLNADITDWVDEFLFN